MTRLHDTGRRSRLAIAAGWTLAAAMLFMGNWLPVAVAAEAEKVAADAPLTLKPGAELPKGKWVDVMTPVDTDWDAVSGAWRKGAWDGLSGTWRPQGNDLTVARSSFQRIMLPVELEGSYELKVELTRLTSMKSVEVLFPVGKRTCMMSLASFGERTHGLSTVDGKKAFEHDNPAIFTPGKLVNLQRYSLMISLRLDGDKANVDVSLDGHPLIAWSGRQESLDIEPCYSLRAPYRPALAGNDSDVVFHSALVRSLDRKARMAPSHVAPAIDTNDGHWIDLVKDVNPERDAVEGRWLKAGGGIEVARVSQDARCVRLMLPRQVERSYDLLAEFTRTKGCDSVNLTLPVGTRQCTLHLSAFAGQNGGLEGIDGQFINNCFNPALRYPSGLVNGKKYQVLAQVRTHDDNAVVDTWLDGKPFVHWAGKQSSIDISKPWSLPERWHAGIGANQCGVTFHMVRLRPVEAAAAPSARATN